MVATKEQKRRGRPKVLTAADLAQLKALVEGQPDLSLRQIQSLMERRCGKRATSMTWSRALKQMGLQGVRRAKQKEAVEESVSARTTRMAAVPRRISLSSLHGRLGSNPGECSARSRMGSS